MASEAIVAVLTFAIVTAIGILVYVLFAKYISKWTKRTKTSLDDKILHSIRATAVFSVLLAGFYYALRSLSYFDSYTKQLTQSFQILIVLLVAFTLTNVVNALTDWYVNKNGTKKARIDNHLLFILKKIFQLVIYVIALLAILAVLEVNLSGVIVGLGVGGIAIALAIQSVLGDVFGAFSIYFDRPFEIGDFIVVGPHSGTVTNIGIRSTRVKLLQGEELVLSNKELLSSSVRNFKKLDKRRIAFTIGVTYDTSSEKLRKIPAIITEIFANIELAEMDRVHFTEFGDYGLKFEIVYFVKVADYRKYMDTQQAINYAIREEFEKEGIEMAFPTQTIFIAKQPSN